MSALATTPVFRVPTGIDRLGFPTYGSLPAGVPNPPSAWGEARELATVEQLNAAANASPVARQFTAYLAERGGFGIWMDMAAQYRRNTGFLRGWMGTGLLLAALGASTLRAQVAKRSYDRLRPYQLDPRIHPIGKLSSDAGYPSGHTTAAFTAATVLSALWPARAQEFTWWANQVGLSRVHAGAHFPSDVRAGAALGTQTGLAAVSALF